MPTVCTHVFCTLNRRKTDNTSVYFFRWIIHNYSTPYAVKLLKNLVSALKPGARIVINDHCLRESGSENPWDEKLMRSMDMIMLTLLNAQERAEQEFRDLFKAADERFVFKVSVAHRPLFHWRHSRMLTYSRVSQERQVAE